MSLSWHQRKNRLASLLKTDGGDEDAEGLALDRLMHGQNVIGKTAKTTEVDALRFKDRDLDVVGTLEYGQFGVIDVVTCKLDNCVYVRKSIQKKFALRTRDQCSPQFERDILLQALKTDTPWVPHLLCAFQTPTHLSLVMDYAEGGTLWDVLESSPHDGRILESDMMWWIPQIVSAIHWCHLQGFVHRDIKPHNFVLTPDAHLQLIDFGSSAPLLPPNPDGSQLIAKRYCLVPCGTCDYISPEILQAHEEALLALEMEDEDEPIKFGETKETEGYGLETDWWSLGVMLYEMVYGVAPFFANDIRQTYTRIMNHEKSLRFDQKVDVSHEYQHFLRRLLTHAKQRLGRRNVMEITDHPLFNGVNWTTLSTVPAPADLHLPQFTYASPEQPAQPDEIPMNEPYEESASLSQGFAFSAFFQPSSNISPGLSVLRPSPGSTSKHLNTPLAVSTEGASNSATSFIGFSWGPNRDAFPDETPAATSVLYTSQSSETQPTPRPLIRTPLRPQQVHQTPGPFNHTHNTLSVPPTWGPGTFSTPGPFHAFSTPVKAYAVSPYATLPRTSTIRRTAPRRNVSDREAMKQLVDCVGMSARKKVLESGRKPKVLNIFGSKGANSGRRRSGSMTGTMSKGTDGTRKELRFDRFTTPIPRPDYSGVSSIGRSAVIPELKFIIDEHHDASDVSYPYPPQQIYNEDTDQYVSSETSDSEGGGPPSPSPSPRPGSAMSMMSMSRRSATPTVSGCFSSTGMLSRKRSMSGSNLVPLADRSVTATTTTTSSGLLSIPSTGAINLDFKIGKPPPPLAQVSPMNMPLGEPMKIVERTFSRPEVTKAQAQDSDPQVSLDNKSSFPPLLLPRPPAQTHRRRHSVGTKKQVNSSGCDTDSTRPVSFLEEDDKSLDRMPPQTQTHRRRHSVGTTNRGYNMAEQSSKEWYDELERRHATIMEDIESLENRFYELSRVVGN
ncbi:Serine/threonine-protein kinase MRCK gamma [Psilocybe cubensis]|uniref:Serine/threonine-protein kinase MRCK gamma n=2 Tax=Psilocybe cubensis TaxID=181762 RepID=A0ACB8GKQ5_PSICU|nr:Serine/threonine-protein kinase MRCK gamma [Psilocybe cubensis]KAH9476305.1 Serine/threonine-protein kinase MRCK gamma [Psilocybe cubensis]